MNNDPDTDEKFLKAITIILISTEAIATYYYIKY